MGAWIDDDQLVRVDALGEEQGRLPRGVVELHLNVEQRLANGEAERPPESERVVELSGEDARGLVANRRLGSDSGGRMADGDSGLIG